MVHYLHLISAVVTKMLFFGTIWNKVALYLEQIYNHNWKNGSRNAPSYGAIRDEFSDVPYSMPNLHFFCEKGYNYNAYFGDVWI